MTDRRTDPILDADLFQIPAGPGALHVERYGQGGESIVLLHGFATSSFLWRSVAPVIAAAGHTALAVDLMGYGESDRPIDGDYSIVAQAEYVRHAMHAMHIPRFAIAGVDIGGGVAQRLAVTAPGIVSGLALLNSVGLDECPGREVREVQRATARFALRVAREVLGVTAILREPLERSVADPARMPDRLVARYLSPYVGQAGVAHLLTLARALKLEDIEDLDLSTISAPTVIIWGEEDPWLDGGLAERLHAVIAGSALIRLPHVGRLSPEDAPAAVAQLLIDWLATSVGGAAADAPGPEIDLPTLRLPTTER